MRKVSAKQHFSRPECFEAWVRKKQVGPRGPIAPMREDPSVIRGPALLAEPPTAEVSEGRSEFKIALSLIGVDPRNVYVLATSASLLVDSFEEQCPTRNGARHCD